ncbi:hypothetical protein BD779DRAFT_1795101 [Infundibulicybe gibba]|nr:hypothetical protein BD779DRAFT_1795101 [Infundibulicybe gibba]
MACRKRRATEQAVPTRPTKLSRTTRQAYLHQHPAYYPRSFGPTPEELCETRTIWVMSSQALNTIGTKIWNFFVPTAPDVSEVLPTSYPVAPNRREPSDSSAETVTPSDAPPLASSSTISPPPPEQSTFLVPDLQTLKSYASSPSLQRTESLDNVIKRRYKNREHIYSKRHKASVAMRNEELREAMQLELYNISRSSSGYKSDFTTFKHYISYKAHLEALQGKKEVISRSPSLDESRLNRPSESTRARRHSHSSVDIAFLKRALEAARATLNGHKPIQSFSPGHDRLLLTKRAKLKRIDNLLRPPFPDSLPPEDETTVERLKKKRGVVSKIAREQVTDRDLTRLGHGQWLNDEIINFYGALILTRSEDCKKNIGTPGKAAKGGQVLDVHVFSTFFWPKLTGDGYAKGRLSKWTKKMDIFNKDIILIPVNHANAHWTAAAINFRQKRIESYDSMGMTRSAVFRHLRAYVDAEHREKKRKAFDFTGWVDWAPEDTPQQENGYDCGVFTCQFLESLSRGVESFRFSQNNMHYLRRRMIWEIGSARLRDEY